MADEGGGGNGSGTPPEGPPPDQPGLPPEPRPEEPPPSESPPREPAPHDARDPVQRGVDTVRQTIIDIGGIIDGVANRVKSIVNDAIRDVFEPLSATLQGTVNIVGQLVEGLLGSLATPADVISGAYEKWLELSLQDTGPGTALTRWILHNLGPNLSDQAKQALKASDPPVLRNAAEGVPSAPDIGSVYGNYNNSPGVIKWAWDFIGNVLLTGAFLQALAAPELMAAQQDALRHAPTQQLSPADLANMVVQTIVPQGYAAEQALRSGITPELFDLMVKQTGMPPSLQEMLSLLNRGFVDEAAVRLAIAQSHTKTEYTDNLIKLRFAVPTPAEITHWLTRDAFIEDFVQRYQMDAEYDLSAAQADPLYQANAVDKSYVKYIWRAHWTLPSPTMGAEMFQRTDENGTGDSHNLPSGASIKSVVGRADLERLYRAAGYEPFWRNKLLAISYNPLNRIDSRRMYMAGLIDDDRFYRAQLDIGYDEANAGLLLAWIRAQKKAAQAKQNEQHFAPLINHMRDLYRRGLMGSQDVRQQAISVGIDPDHVDLWISIDDLEVTRKKADAMRAGLRHLFVNGFVTEDEAARRATADGFTTAEWVRLRDEWAQEREFRVLSEDERRVRELTKGQLLTAYKDRLLSQDELRTHLHDMGYHNDEVNIWISLADYEETKRITDMRREAVHADFVDEQIDVAEARAGLAHLQLPADHIEALLSRWLTERRRREPQLTVGDIERLYLNKLIGDPEATDLLHRLRYHSEEIGHLLDLWRLNVGLSAERLAIAQQRLADQERQFVERQSAAAQARSESVAARQAAASAEAQRRAEAATLAFQRSEARAAETEQRTQSHLDQRAQQAADRQEKALAERDKLAAAANEARARAEAETDARQKIALQADADRQQRAFEHADAQHEQRNKERIDAEKRAQQYKLDAEGRAETRRIRQESRQQQFRVQAEQRGEARGLRRELRALSATRAREERAVAARVAAEQRVAERQATLAAAAATAQQTIAQLRQSQGLPIAQAAEADFADAATKARQRLQALGEGEG